MKKNHKRRKQALSALLAFVLAACMLCGCEFYKSYNNTNCYIYSVYGASTGTRYICENQTDTFIYQDVNSESAIHSVMKAEPLVSLDAHQSLNCMAASDDILIYATGADEGTLFLYSLRQDSMLYEIDDYAAYSMKACENDVFVTVKLKEYKYDEEKPYDILLFHGEDNYISLSEAVSALTPVKEQDSFLFFSYNGYMIVADNALYGDELQIVYIEREGFGYSCLPYNTHIYYGDVMYCIETQPDFLPENEDGNGGIDSSMVYEQDGECCFVAQYSKIHYRGQGGQYDCNPPANMVKENYLCKYNLTTNEFEILYEAKKDEQIAGFSPKANEIYLLKNEGIYKKNITTGETVLLLENEFKDEEQYGMGTYVFENHGDKLAVFSVSRRTQTMSFIMDIPY